MHYILIYVIMYLVKYGGDKVLDENDLLKKEYSVHGGSILVFGDLHLSSSYEGQHKSYISDCMFTLNRIRELVAEKKPRAVFFLGDLIGVRERNIKDRRFLREVLLFFKELNEVCDVYSVKGNHDFGDFSDFDLLLGLGYIKNPKVVDFYGDDESPQVRFHFVNYGYEDKPLQFSEDNSFSNAVLCHSDIQIPGVTNWYKTKGGHVLSSLSNWSGVEFVIAGHIHNPSVEFSYTTLDGSSVGLFYPGSPSRTAERYDDCWYLLFNFSKGVDDVGEVNFSAELFGLPKADVVFFDKDEFIGDEEDMKSIEDIRSESLVNIVKEVMDGRVVGGDLFSQIRVMPGASDRAKDLACRYLQKALDETVK